MPTVDTAQPSDIWPRGSGHPREIEEQIIKVARTEITPTEVARSGCGFAPWFTPFWLAEQRVLERQQRQPQETEIDRLLAENRDLRSRLGLLERWALPDKKGDFPLMDLIVDVVAEVLGRTRKEINERIDRLERAAPVPLPSAADLAGVGQGPVVRYEGVWDRTKGYAPGAMVTRDGVCWIAVNAVATGTEPGRGETAWRLALKSSTAGLRKMVQDEVRKQLSSKPPVVR